MSAVQAAVEASEFDETREFFPDCTAAIVAVPRYLPMVGPLTPTPGLTLADAVEGRAA